MCTSPGHTCTDIRKLAGGRWGLNRTPPPWALLGTEHQRGGGPSCFRQQTINIRNRSCKSFIKRNGAGEGFSRF